MNPYEKKGFALEFDFAFRLRSHSGVSVISQFQVFSHALQRSTAIDVLALTASNVILYEAKNVSSALEGGYNDRYWWGRTGLHRRQIFNPVCQIKHKVRAMRRAFWDAGKDPDELTWHYYVVVPHSCKIMADRTVVKSEDEAAYILSGLAASDPKIDDSVLLTIMTGVNNR